MTTTYTEMPEAAPPGAYMAPTYTHPPASTALITVRLKTLYSGYPRPVYSTKVLTFYPISDSHNANYNHNLYPASEENGVIMVYKAVIIYPWYGSVLSALIPVLVITIYPNILSIFYAGIRLIEPFTLLSRPGGALGKDV